LVRRFLEALNFNESKNLMFLFLIGTGEGAIEEGILNRNSFETRGMLFLNLLMTTIGIFVIVSFAEMY
jgi:hypothetical protein